MLLNNLLKIHGYDFIKQFIIVNHKRNYLASRRARHASYSTTSVFEQAKTTSILGLK